MPGRGKREICCLDIRTEFIGKEEVRGVDALAQQFADEWNREKPVDMEESHKIIADDADVHGNGEIGVHLRKGLPSFSMW